MSLCSDPEAQLTNISKWKVTCETSAKLHLLIFANLDSLVNLDNNLPNISHITSKQG